MSVDWYDLLDVPRDADTDTIRAAWKAAVADLDPTDKTFRVYSQAAEVLLDPDRRAAYDATLAPEEPGESADSEQPAADERPTEPAAPTWPASREATSQPADASGTYLTPAEVTGGGRTGWWQPPLWLLGGLALLAALIAAGAWWWSAQVASDEEIEQETTSAQASAEKAVVDALAYDYRNLEKSHEDAVAHMTEDYREDDYEPLFSVIEANAAEVKPVVTVKVVASAVVRTGERTEVLVFFNRQTTNKSTAKARTSYDQATLTMENVDGTWLIDDIKTS